MDMTTTYLGFELPHPFMPGASPLSDNLSTVRQLEDAGAAVITLRSLFEEQLTRESMTVHRDMDMTALSSPEALSYFPEPAEFILGPDEYLEHLRAVKEAVNVPVVASLNGTTSGGWLNYAKLIEQAGADALELHIYSVPTDPRLTGEDHEADVVRMVTRIKQAVSIPVAAKLSSFYTSIANLAVRLDATGLDGMVLFNRFYQPDIDVEELEVVNYLKLSESAELGLRLRGLAIVSGNVKASLGVTGGVHTCLDAVKAIMCGANAVQMVSSLLLHGPQHLSRIRDEVAEWLEENEYNSLRQMIGSMSLKKCPDPSEFIRGNYMRVLQTWHVD